MQRPIRLLRGAILLRGARGSPTQRQHGNPTFTPQTVARNLEIRVRGQSPWNARHQKVVIVPCIPHCSVHLRTDALNPHIHWRLCAPVQRGPYVVCRIDGSNAMENNYRTDAKWQGYSVDEGSTFCRTPNLNQQLLTPRRKKYNLRSPARWRGFLTSPSGILRSVNQQPLTPRRKKYNADFLRTKKN